MTEKKRMTEKQAKNKIAQSIRSIHVLTQEQKKELINELIKI